MTKTLFRKFRREFGYQKGQLIALIMIILVGMISFNSINVSFVNLRESKTQYYEESNFADVWVEFLSYPKEKLSDFMDDYPQIEKVQGRLRIDVPIFLENSDRKVYGRIHSYSEGDTINKVNVDEGRLPHKNRNELALEIQFARNNDLKLGDKIEFSNENESYEYKITGLVSSAEYVYPMRDAREIIPEIGGFGVIFMDYEDAKKVYRNNSVYNEVLITTAAGTDLEKLVLDIEKDYDKYNLRSVYEQEDQLSNVILSSELDQLKGTAVVFPLVFLIVSSVIIYIVLLRIIERQRGQIGLLKSFGYSQLSIVTYYMLFGIITCFTGGIIGGIIGQYLGYQLTILYTEFFNIPILTAKIYWDVFLQGLGLTLFFSTLGGFQAIKEVIKLTPAEAIRPASPNAVRKIPFIDKINIKDVYWNYAFRNLLRQKFRTFVTVMGVALSVALMISTLFSLDAMDFLINKHFKNTNRYDYKMILQTPVKANKVLAELNSDEHIFDAEPFLEIPVRAENEWRTEYIMISGIQENSTNYELRDENEKVVKIQKNKIVLAEKWREKLGIEEGDLLKVKNLMGKPRDCYLEVQGFVPKYLEFNGYMNFRDLNRIIGESQVTNNVLLKTRNVTKDELLGKYNKYTNFSFLENDDTFKEKFDEYLDFTYFFIGITILFGSLIAVSIVYVTNSVNLLERKNEIALLKSIGYKVNEINQIIFKENLITNVIGLLVGFLLGYLLSYGISKSYGDQIMVIPVVTYPRTYLEVSLTIIIVLLVLNIPNRKFINRINLVESLKDREG